MVKVRQAEERDLQAMLDMGQTMHAESPRYRDRSWDRDKVSGLLGWLSRPLTSETVIPAGCLLVAENDQGELIGMMAGVIDAYFFGQDLIAQDLFLYVRPEHRGNMAALRLIKSFESLVASIADVDIQLGVSTEIDSDRTVCVYERLGYKMSAYGLMKSRN